LMSVYFFFSSRRRHTRCLSDWSSDVCSSDLQNSESEQKHSAGGRTFAGGNHGRREGPLPGYRRSIGDSRYRCFLFHSTIAEPSRSEERRVGKVRGNGGCTYAVTGAVSACSRN